MDKDKYIGQLLDDRYEILEVIGIGGMAVVYKAKCHRLNRLVAVKILKEEHMQDREFRERFRGESQAVAMLSHPNIVSIYDVSSSPEAEYIVMELIDGISLKQYMQRKGVLNWKETLHFAIQIAKALEHAHSRGIVHRDIKPHNVMVLKNGAVKVADFGIAQVTSASSTLTTEALGSVHYISPEQAKGGRVDNRSDLYSLGVVMYEMIAGRVPYDGDSPVNIAIQHINGGAQKPSQYNPNTPEGLEQIILKAMALAPRDRYLTATAMLYDMDEFRKNPAVVFPENMTHVQPPARPAEPQPKTIAQRKMAQNAETAVVPENLGSYTPKPAQPEQLPERRSRSTTVAVIACIVVAILAIVIFFVVWPVKDCSGMFDKPEMVSVPNLIGQNFEMLRQDGKIEVVRQGGEYSDEYAKGQIIYQYPLSGEQVKVGTKVFVKISLGQKPPAQIMNYLMNTDLSSARQWLNNLQMGLDIQVREESHPSVAVGNVTRTVPAYGAVLTEGQQVILWVSTGPEAVYGYMPDLSGKTLDDALTILDAKGFHNVIYNPVDSDRPEDEVVGQSVEKFQKIDIQTEIILDISNGSLYQPPAQPDEPGQEPEPGPVPVTKAVIFSVPKRTEGYVLSIKQGTVWVIENWVVAPDTAEVTVSLTGNGTQSYDLYIDGEFYATETVDFESND